jgi:predicted RNA-binding Zn-ribbon protein involved in translation (DUF1610 family)
MDFGDKVIYQCPNCGKLTGSFSVISMNDFGATSYSDGYTRGIMYSDSPEIAKCKKCRTFYWLKKENIIGYYGPLTVNSKWSKAPEPELLEKNDYIKALKRKVYRNKDEERYIRNKVWLAFNSKMRGDIPEDALIFKKDEKTLYESNCKRLIKLYNMANIDEKLIIAELHRNLGSFSESIEILKTIKLKDYIWIKKLLIKECEKKNKKVIKLTKSNGNHL